jgi:6-phosphogluconolactonase (cycloisomerase 2 family)
VENQLNPSYLAFDREKRFLYAAHGDSSDVSAFKIEADGRLSLVNKQSCQGKNPVHLTVDPGNRFLLVANHLTVENYVSNIAVLPRRADGGLEAVRDLMPLTGKIGPHRVEQPFAKPHQVEYDPRHRFLAVPDKGCDLVRTLALSPEGKLSAVNAPMAARPGAGPRHIAFTPDTRFAYVVNELDSTVTACHYASGTGTLTPFQRLSATPDSFTGYSTGAEIAVPSSGRAVYVSNRGHDSIGAFAINPADGRLTSLGWTPCGGRTPRFFALSPDERRIFVANEDGDSITALDIAPSGLLTLHGTVAETGSPTCILFSNL